MKDDLLYDSVNELSSLLYTAESVIGKDNPEILRARELVKFYNAE